MMLRLFTIIMAFASVLTGSAATESADALLSRAAHDLSSAPSVTVDYNLTGSDNSSVKGTLIMSGERFYISMPHIKVWYDGNTQWVYNAETQEVSISEPTAEELQQINPFVIINRFRSAYKATLQPASSPLRKVRLTSLSSRADILQADLTLNGAYQPTEIVLTMANHSRVTVRITRFATGSSLPVGTFRFDTSKYPSAEVIDLR